MHNGLLFSGVIGLIKTEKQSKFIANILIMKTLMIYSSISIFFVTGSACFGQNYKLFKINNITFTIDTLNNSKRTMDIYDELVENPANPSMSFQMVIPLLIHIEVLGVHQLFVIGIFICLMPIH